MCCGRYYKDTAIVKYASSIVNKLEALLTDDARVVIYDRHVFIVQATGESALKGFGSRNLLSSPPHFHQLSTMFF
jgi:hypothetical protein